MNTNLTDIAVELTILTGCMFILSEDGQTLENGDACIHGFLRTWPKPRLVFSPGTPQGIPSYFRTGEITCNPDRNPKDIARDIKNRLLDEAREFHTKNMEHHRKRCAEIEAHREAVRVLDAAGLKHATWGESETFAKMHGNNVTVEMYGTDPSIEIRHLTPYQVVRILETLGE